MSGLGTCPYCGSPVYKRERSSREPEGIDYCTGGCVYPTSDTIYELDAIRKAREDCERCRKELMKDFLANEGKCCGCPIGDRIAAYADRYVVVKVARLKAYEDAEGLLLTMLEAMRSGAVDVTSEPVSDGQRECLIQPWHEEWVSYVTKYEDEYGPTAGPEVKG